MRSKLHWLVAMSEVCISEFHLAYDEFWFVRTFPQVFLLVQARIERNKRSETESKSKPDIPTVRETITPQEMQLFANALG